MDPDGRRGWALVLLALGGVSMTVFAGFALYYVRTVPKFAFYLGLAALFLIGIVLTGFAGLLIKRTIRGSVLGNSFEISDEVAGKIADKVAAAAPPPLPPAPVVIQTGPAAPPPPPPPPPAAEPPVFGPGNVDP
jgi:hypothetical protein